jgi:hypothetical protein
MYVFPTYIVAATGIFGSINTTTIPIENITGVEFNGITRRLTVRTNDGKKRRYLLGAFGVNAPAARSAILTAMAMSSAPPQSASPSPGEVLRSLSDLHTQGILTREEFEAKKADLLNRI